MPHTSLYTHTVPIYPHVTPPDVRWSMGHISSMVLAIYWQYLKFLREKLGNKWKPNISNSPPENDFGAHILAAVWEIYWQDIGHTAHISAVYGQYVALSPKPNIGHTVSHIMSTFVPYFFFSKYGPHYKRYVGKLWPIFGWGAGATYGPYIAHTLSPQFFLRGRLE